MKQFKNYYLMFLVFLLVSPNLARGQFKEIDIEEYQLDNGLHVILHQDNSSPVVAINITYHVGSKNEDPERTGFAHFFEHLMFEGSENIGRGEYFKYVQNAGGQNNAGTSFDYTTYYEVLPSNQLALGLWLESERLLHLKIDSIGVETQRSVVKEERKMRYENQPYGSFLEEIFSHAFDVHPYRWVPIGSVQYIDQAKLEEFIEFYSHYYVPNNAVLVIAGDIQIDETKKLVEDYFSGIPKGTHRIIRPDVTEPEKKAEVVDTVYDNIQLPAAIMGYQMPPRTHEDYHALDMLQKLLSGGESSRLYKELVDNQQLAVAVQAVPLTLEDAGLFIILGIASLGTDIMEVQNALEKEINEVKNNLIDEREFQKLVNSIENDVISSNSTMEGISYSLAQYHIMFDDASMINKELEKYMKVTREDIKRVANDYLNKDNRVTLYYLPMSQSPEGE
jgi:predicted Zn-dependent peptidase